MINDAQFFLHIPQLHLLALNYVILRQIHARGGNAMIGQLVIYTRKDFLRYKQFDEENASLGSRGLYRCHVCVYNKSSRAHQFRLPPFSGINSWLGVDEIVYGVSTACFYDYCCFCGREVQEGYIGFTQFLFSSRKNAGSCSYFLRSNYILYIFWEDTVYQCLRELYFRSTVSKH